MLSFWEKNSFLNYDYIIIGSGILGLSTACEIKERFPEKEVVVLERGIFPTGASTRNAGFLCFGSLTEILADIKLKGESKAAELVEKRRQGITMLKKRLDENKMGYLSYGGYELIYEKYQGAVEQMEYVNELLKDYFRDPVFEIHDDKIRQFGFSPEHVKHLVYSRYEAQIDTGQMMKALLKYAQSTGVQIINGCNVKNVEGSKVTAEHTVLNEEVIFCGEKVIICANAFAGKLAPNMSIKPGRGQVLITRPVNDLKFKGIFHMEEGYYYFRNFGKRVIFGGGRNLDFASEETGEFLRNEKILAELKSKLDNIILPGTKYEVEDSWTGIMGFTEDKLPKIQEIEENVIAAISCNGMGIALSSYIAREIVDKL